MPQSEIPNPQSEIQLLVFDAGGVMVRICHGGWAQVCERIGVDRPRAIDDESGCAELAKVGEAFETGRIDEATFVSQAARISELTEAQIAAALDAWLIEPYADLAPFVERVVATGVPTAVLSNTNPPHWRLMCTDSHAGLPVDRFTHRFTSFEIGAMKPDAAIYEHVERATGVEPAAILFFDDHPPNIAAAQQRGWHAVRIDHHGDSVKQMTDELTRRGLLR